MEAKNTARKAVTSAVGARLQDLPAGFNVLGRIGNPYAFTVIDPEGRRFSVTVKEEK